MVNESHVGSEVEYRGDALGKFPKGIDHVVMMLASVCGEAAFLRSTSGFIFGVNISDCRLTPGDPRVSPIAFLPTEREAFPELDSIHETEGLGVQKPTPLLHRLDGRRARSVLDQAPDWTIAPVDNLILGVSASARSRSRSIRHRG